MANSPRKLRWYQFSLRSLLIAVLLVSIGLSWCAVQWRRTEREEAAARILTANGVGVSREFPSPRDYREPSWRSRLFGSPICCVALPREVAVEAVEALAECTEVEHIYAWGSDLDDATIAHLHGLRLIRRLDLRGTRVTEKGLSNLGCIPTLETLLLNETAISDDLGEVLREASRLQSLSLRDTALSDAGLCLLARLPRLASLKLDNTRVTHKGLACLAEISSLREVTLNGTQIDDQSIPIIARCESLEELELSRTSLREPDLACLNRLSSLKGLILSYTQISDRHVLQLSVPTLIGLGLRGTKVSDACIDHLASFPQLSGVDLRETLVTEAGAKKLRGLRTQTNVRWRK
jgi:hypothetical protein